MSPQWGYPDASGIVDGGTGLNTLSGSSGKSSQPSRASLETNINKWASGRPHPARRTGSTVPFDQIGLEESCLLHPGPVESRLRVRRGSPQPSCRVSLRSGHRRGRAGEGDLVRITSGESQRFRDLYVAHYAAVLSYCLRRLRRDEAHDAAAEVFTVAWRRMADVPLGDRALPWLYGVAARIVSNQRRSQRRRRGLSTKLRGLGETLQPQPDAQVVRRNEDQEIIDAINRLRAGDREVLLLSAWEGLPAAQLAERFGISLKAAEQRLTRAKRRLAAELGQAGRRVSVVRHRGGGKEFA